jgi:hypothetical protein
MQQPKEYYWQGKGGSDVTLEKIVSELLGRDPDNYTETPVTGELTDVYTLQFDCWDDVTAVEGHSIIHVPHDEHKRITFNMVLLKYDEDSTNMATVIDQDKRINNSLIDDIEDFGFAVYLRKIASNQPHRFDWS